MKAIILISVFLFISIGSLQSQDFRKSYWGDSKEKIKASNPEVEWEVSGENMGHETTIGGMSAYVFYFIIKDQLYKAGYAFNVKHSNKNIFIQDFDKIETILIKKYGSSNKKNNQVWMNSLYKDDTDDWGMAVSIGHLAYISTFTPSMTDIEHSLSGDNYKISHKILYIARALKNLEQQQKDEQNLSDF